jgi:nucleosome binding factor SPN SPT16 subunit
MSDKIQACPDDLNAITDRLTVLIALEEASAARHIQILRTRRKEDAEVKRTRKREDKQVKERRSAEDLEFIKDERGLDEEEEACFQIVSYRKIAYFLTGTSAKAKTP